MKIYLDTSVYGMAVDGDEPRKTLENLVSAINKWKFTTCYSDTLLTEFDDAPQRLQKEFLAFLKAFSRKTKLKETNKTLALADRYVAFDVFTSKSLADAKHVALATLGNVDYILSMNMKHFVRNAEIITEVNKRLSLPRPQIIAPTQFLKL